ncbi:hypothetical protein FPQ18DRAFT_310246 [Pyronema domesticum]|nr:hypothetical protein FPQ18DRAFT_310246 [Pyronema domesticum]
MWLKMSFRSLLVYLSVSTLAIRKNTVEIDEDDLDAEARDQDHMNSIINPASHNWLFMDNFYSLWDANQNLRIQFAYSGQPGTAPLTLSAPPARPQPTPSPISPIVMGDFFRNVFTYDDIQMQDPGHCSHCYCLAPMFRTYISTLLLSSPPSQHLSYQLPSLQTTFHLTAPLPTASGPPPTSLISSSLSHISNTQYPQPICSQANLERRTKSSRHTGSSNLVPPHPLVRPLDISIYNILDSLETLGALHLIHAVPGSLSKHDIYPTEYCPGVSSLVKDYAKSFDIAALSDIKKQLIEALRRCLYLGWKNLMWNLEKYCEWKPDDFQVSENKTATPTIKSPGTLIRIKTRLGLGSTKENLAAFNFRFKRGMKKLREGKKYDDDEVLMEATRLKVKLYMSIVYGYLI